MIWRYLSINRLYREILVTIDTQRHLSNKYKYKLYCCRLRDDSLLCLCACHALMVVNCCRRSVVIRRCRCCRCCATINLCDWGMDSATLPPHPKLGPFVRRVNAGACHKFESPTFAGAQLHKWPKTFRRFLLLFSEKWFIEYSLRTNRWPAGPRQWAVNSEQWALSINTICSLFQVENENCKSK